VLKGGIREALAAPEMWPTLITCFHVDTAAATWVAIYKAITERMRLEVEVQA